MTLTTACTNMGCQGAFVGQGLKILLLMILQFRWTFCQQAGDTAYLPELKTKIIGPAGPTPTPLPASEQPMWGLRLWQVAGFFFVGTVIMVVICCCLCDCRVPKAKKNYEPAPKQTDDDTGSDDSEPTPLRKGPSSRSISRAPSFTNRPAPAVKPRDYWHSARENGGFLGENIRRV